jgi:hypothetical protein
LTIRIIGKGIDPIFGFWGAGISLVSILLGNILSIIGFIANSGGLRYLVMLLYFNYSLLPEIMIKTFKITDLVVYWIGLTVGFAFSFRRITEKSIYALKKFN